MGHRGLELLRDKLVLASKNICPAAIFDDVAKKHPEGIAEKWFDATSLPDPIKVEPGRALDSKPTRERKVKAGRPGLDSAFARVTRSKTKRSITAATDASNRAGPADLDGTSDVLGAGAREAFSMNPGGPLDRLQPQDPGADSASPFCNEVSLPFRFKGYSPVMPGRNSSSSSSGSNNNENNNNSGLGQHMSKLALGDPAMVTGLEMTKKCDSLSPKDSQGKGPPRLKLLLTCSDESLRSTASGKNRENKTKRRGGSPCSQSSSGSLKRISFYDSTSESPEMAAADQPRREAGAAGKRPTSICEDGYNSHGVKRVKFVESSPESEEGGGGIVKDGSVVSAEYALFRMRPGHRSTNDQLARNSLHYESQNASSIGLHREQSRKEVDTIDLTASDGDEDEQETSVQASPEAQRVVRPMASEQVEKHRDQAIKQAVRAATEPVKQTANHGHKKRESNASDSTLSSIDEQQMADLERCHSEYVQTNSTGSDALVSSSSSSSSGSSFTASPQHSSSTAAAAAATATTTTTTTTKATTASAPSPSPSFPRFIVLDAQTWNLVGYNTAARARARCQEHPVPESRRGKKKKKNNNNNNNNKRNKNTRVQARRNAKLAVAAPIDIGHGGMQLFVHDAAHNSVATALMRSGVAGVAREWDGAFARIVVLGREKSGVGEWARERGLLRADADHPHVPDAKLADPGVPCLYYDIRAKVDELRRIEGYEKKEERTDVAMVDAN